MSILLYTWLFSLTLYHNGKKKWWLKLILNVNRRIKCDWFKKIIRLVRETTENNGKNPANFRKITTI